MLTSVIGYPRIGAARELKFWTEDYFKGAVSGEQLRADAKELRLKQIRTQKDQGIDLIASNDFSFYDGMLDTAALMGVIPERYRALELNELDTYFAMARGYQGEKGDVKALPMRKWFNTNYHYIVSGLDDDTHIKLSGTKPFDEFQEAQKEGILTKPVVIGPFSFLKLSQFKGKRRMQDYAEEIIQAYTDLLTQMDTLGVQWLQIDEPILVTDLNASDIAFFTQLYAALLKHKGRLNLFWRYPRLLRGGNCAGFRRDWP